MELNTYIMDQITELETRIEQLENVLKTNNINLPKSKVNSKVNIIEDKKYPFILKELEVTEYSDRWGSWCDSKFVDHKMGDINGFNTAEEAIAYVRSHLDQFPSRVYLYDVINKRIRKIKKQV